MFYYLFEYLAENGLPYLENLYKFITFRAGMALILSLIISIVFGKYIIGFLQKLQIGEIIRDLGLEGQLKKQGTPTMGGVLIIMAILIPSLLLAKLHNVYILLLIICTIWLGMIGFLDDYIKVFKKDKEGLSGRFKILGQVVLGLIVGVTMLFHQDVTVRVTAEEAETYDYEILDRYTSVNRITKDTVEYAKVKTTLTNVPFFKDNELDYAKILWFLDYDIAKKFVWIIFIPVIIFIVTAVSNAANLTDGLDGLATGISAIIMATLGILAYVSGNTLAADYLNILYLPETGELLVFAAAFIGACIGFLWYNSFPAQVFMGDTGSLTLGGIIAAFAIIIRKELLIPLLCGVFLVESLSVMIQVSYFKYTKRKYGEGRRVFLMSPIHHHYQKKGIPESKIVMRFWIVALLLAALTIITLKFR